MTLVKPSEVFLIKMTEQSFEYQATFKNHIRFEIPYNLEDPSIVKEWYIKYGELRITLINDEEVIIDGLLCECDYKHPDNVYNENGDDILD